MDKNKTILCRLTVSDLAARFVNNVLEKYDEEGFKPKTNRDDIQKRIKSIIEDLINSVGNEMEEKKRISQKNFKKKVNDVTKAFLEFMKDSKDVGFKSLDDLEPMEAEKLLTDLRYTNEEEFKRHFKIVG